MGLQAPRQSEVDQAARWLLKKQQELITGREVHGIKFDVKLPLLPAKVDMFHPHSLPLALSFLLLTPLHSQWLIPHVLSLVLLSRANPSPKLKSNPSIFPCDYLRLSPNLLISSPFTIKQFILKIIVIAVSDIQLFQVGWGDQHGIFWVRSLTSGKISRAQACAGVELNWHHPTMD